MLAIRADGYCGHTDELDMEFSEIHVNNPSLHVEDVVPHEDEKERASNCYVMSLVAVMIGLPMPIINLLATGIFLGAVWANVSWGTYWSWDPKESWALITLLVYSIPLHNKSLPWFNSIRNYRIYSLLAFACLLMTYFGVNFLLGGMHSYAG